MKFNMRKTFEKALPAFLSKRIVYLGKFFKRLIRQSRRFLYGMGKPFVKKVGAHGVFFKLVLDPHRNAGVDESIANDGFWENDLSQQWVNHIKKGDVFFDVGANIGYHSLFVASILDGTGKVHSFEPLPELCDQLHKSVTENGYANIEIHNFGLSDKEEERDIYIRDENTGGSSLLSFPNIASVAVSKTKRIRTKTLDASLPADIRIDVMKIDTEGFEYEVLKGAAAALTRNHPVIFMEFSPVFYKQDYEKKPYDLAAFLRGLGYSFFKMDGEKLDLENWLREGDNINTQLDIICKVAV